MELGVVPPREVVVIVGILGGSPGVSWGLTLVFTLVVSCGIGTLPTTEVEVDSP